MPNPKWSFDSDGSIKNDVGTVKHFTEIMTNHTSNYSTDRTLTSDDISGTINLTGGSKYTLPTNPVVNDRITVVNSYNSDIILNFNETSEVKISPGGVTIFVCVVSGAWVILSSSKNPIFNKAVNSTDPVTLLDMNNAVRTNYATQSSVTTITNLPSTLDSSVVGGVIVLNSSTDGILTLYDPRAKFNNTYPTTLLMNVGSGKVTINANALNGVFTEQNNTLLTGQYMAVFGGSNGVFSVLHTNNRNPFTNGLLLESGLFRIASSIVLTKDNIGGIYVYSAGHSDNINITLPAASSVLNGHTARFTFVNRSTGIITLVCSGTDVIANGSNELYPNTYKTIISDGSTIYFVVSDNSDLALKNGSSSNTFSVATPITGTDAVNVNKLYSELNGVEGYAEANVTLTNTNRVHRYMHFIYAGAQTVVLPPLSSRSVSGSGLTLLLKTSLNTTLTILVSASDTYDTGYSNVLNPGEYVILTYNATDTKWKVMGGNISHSAAASNMERIMGMSAFFVSLFGSANATAVLNTIGGAPLASPALTGTPTTPNVAADDNSTKIANTAFVSAMLKNKQPLSGALTALANLKTTNGDLIYATGQNTFTTTALTGLARTLLSNDSSDKMRATLGVDRIPDYNTPTSRSYNTVYQAQQNIYVVALFNGSYMNGAQLLIGTTSTPDKVIGYTGDDINNNTKWSWIGGIIPKYMYWKVVPIFDYSFEGIFINEYPLAAW